MAGENVIEVNAIRFQQVDMPMYMGKMKVADLLDIIAIERWSEQSLDGYQRERYKERVKEVSDYLKDCPIAMMPAILVSLRGGFEFTPTKGNIGVLKIPREEGAAWIIDGQHRLGGFDFIASELKELQERGAKSGEEIEDSKKYSELLNYELPTVFIESEAVTKKIKKLNPTLDVKPTHIEGAFFFIVNKTQKSIRPSLKDALAYRTISMGISGIPVIEREKWRTDAVPIVYALNSNGSPLSRKINLGGVRGLGRPIQLNSFVSSLELLSKHNDAFKSLSFNEKLAFLKSYWNVIKNMFEDSFTYPGDFLVLKTIGVYSLNRLANDVFNWCRSEGVKVPSEDNIRKFLKALKGFNWSKKDSPLAAYGGIKGVKEAHKKLLEYLAMSGVTEASKTVKELEAKK